MVRHDKAGTTSIVVMSVTHANGIATCSGAKSTTKSTKAGTDIQRTNTRAQKRGRRRVAKPANTQTVTKLTSKATNTTMSFGPTAPEA